MHPNSSHIFPSHACDLIARLYATHVLHTQSIPHITEPDLQLFRAPTQSLPFMVHPQRLIQALRTPFIVTRSASTLPPNTSGWQKPDNSVNRPHIGSVNLNLPLSFIHFYTPSESELREIKRICLYHHKHSKHEPWRHVFFLDSSTSKTFLRFAQRSPTPYRKVCSFSTTTLTYTCFASDNHLSHIVDPIVPDSLSRWLSHFSTVSTHLQPHARPH